MDTVTVRVWLRGENDIADYIFDDVDDVDSVDGMLRVAYGNRTMVAAFPLDIVHHMESVMN